MKLPGYMRIVSGCVDDTSVRVSLRIRWWHPGAWVLAVRALWGVMTWK